MSEHYKIQEGVLLTQTEFGILECYLIRPPTEVIKMKSRLVAVAIVATAIGFVGVFAFARNTYTAPDGQVMTPFQFRPEGATSPETAAQAMYLGVATASPRDFGQHVLLGVCNNEFDVLNRYAESLHLTQFSHDGKTFTYYDLRDQRNDSGRLRLIHREKPIRVIASAPFDSTTQILCNVWVWLHCLIFADEPGETPSPRLELLRLRRMLDRRCYVFLAWKLMCRKLNPRSTTLFPGLLTSPLAL